MSSIFLSCTYHLLFLDLHYKYVLFPILLYSYPNRHKAYNQLVLPTRSPAEYWRSINLHLLPISVFFQIFVVAGICIVKQNVNRMTHSIIFKSECTIDTCLHSTIYTPFGYVVISFEKLFIYEEAPQHLASLFSCIRNIASQ